MRSERDSVFHSIVRKTMCIIMDGGAAAHSAGCSPSSRGPWCLMIQNGVELNGLFKTQQHESDHGPPGAGPTMGQRCNWEAQRRNIVCHRKESECGGLDDRRRVEHSEYRGTHVWYPRNCESSKTILPGREPTSLPSTKFNS